MTYYQTILEKVCFDPGLFQKEYYKAVETLTPREMGELRLWIDQRGFGELLGRDHACQPPHAMAGLVPYKSNTITAKSIFKHHENSTNSTII